MVANCTTPNVAGVDSRHSNNRPSPTITRNSYPSKLTLAVAIILLLSTPYPSNNYPLCTTVVEGLTLPSYESTLSFVRPRKVVTTLSPFNTVGNTLSSSRLHTSSIDDIATADGSTTTLDNISETVGLWKLFPKNKRKAVKTNTLVPYGPVPRGGSLSDIPSLPTTTSLPTSLPAGSTSTLQYSANNNGEGAVVLLQQPQRTIPGTRAIRVVKRVVVGTAMNINGIFTSSSSQSSRGRTITFSNGYSRSSTRAVNVNGSNRLSSPNQQQQRRVNTNVSNNNSILRVGRSISLHRKRRRAVRSANILASQSIVATTDLTTPASVGGASKLLDKKTTARKGATRNANKGTVDTLGLGNVNAWITNTLESSTILDDPTSIDMADSKSVAAEEESSAVEEENLTVEEERQPSIPIVGRFFQQQRTKDIEMQQHEIELGYTSASNKYDSSTSSHSISNDALSSIRGGSSTASVAVDSSASTRSTSMEEGVYVIETPLFPIILPRSFEPRTKVSSPSTASSADAEGASVTSLEISVALPQVSSLTQEEEIKPSQQLLEAATQPLLPKHLLSSFTGRELYYPTSIESLVQTGIQMTLDETMNEHVTWIGEKKTNIFLKEQGAVNGDTTSVMNSNDWYKVLDTTQEVLVWSGKASINKDDGYGSELPIIKSISIIHQSPKYLTSLLMDSSKVQIYNKMSLGRVDEKVFQVGVDNINGKFGNDGETKIVRNLTKPPMVSSLLEFVTCMHARRLKASDLKILNPNRSDIDDEDTSGNTGYVVVSRAVTGGEWSNAPSSTSPNGEKLVRNEILLGVNILKPIPGEPYKTEMTSVTHVYSPLIPLMLAKNAGVKGAVDFVRDIRALPTVQEEEE